MHHYSRWREERVERCRTERVEEQLSFQLFEELRRKNYKLIQTLSHKSSALQLRLLTRGRRPKRVFHHDVDHGLIVRDYFGYAEKKDDGRWQCDVSRGTASMRRWYLQEEMEDATEPDRDPSRGDNGHPFFRTGPDALGNKECTSLQIFFAAL